MENTYKIEFEQYYGEREDSQSAIVKADSPGKAVEVWLELLAEEYDAINEDDLDILRAAVKAVPGYNHGTVIFFTDPNQDSDERDYIDCSDGSMIRKITIQRMEPLEDRLEKFYQRSMQYMVSPKELAQKTIAEYGLQDSLSGESDVPLPLMDRVAS